MAFRIIRPTFYALGAIGYIPMWIRHVAPMWESAPLACIPISAAMAYTALSIFNVALEAINETRN